jgi:DNA-binding response OmpR family regulator
MNGELSIPLPDVNGERAPTIVIAEDELALRRLVVKALALSGYNVVATATVCECVEYFRRAHRVGGVAIPALLLSDVHLPDGTGLEIAQRLESIWQGPTVLLTAFCSSELLGRARALGHEVLEKPFDIAHLSNRIEFYVPQGSSR